MFVHDAWHDERCWLDVQAHLSRRRVASVAPTLPSTDPGRGLGLRRPGFAADVDAVLDVLDGLPGPAVLCGHGYGGMVISEAGNHDRVKRLVYLAAACPRPGERGIDHAGHLARAVRLTGDGRMTLAPRAAVRRLYGDLAPAEARARAAALRPSTAGILDARSIAPAWLDTPTTYVICGRDRALDRRRVRACADDVMVHQLGLGRADGYSVWLDTGHSPFYSAPEAVADVVAEPRRVNGYPKR